MSFVLVQVIVGGLLLGAVYALFSSGLTLVWGMMNVVNFAHGDFVMLGMYVAFVVWTLMGGGPAAAVPLAALVLASIGIVCYFALIRHVMRGPMLAQILGTFGLALLLRYSALWYFGASFRTLPETLAGGTLLLGPIRIESSRLLAGSVALAVTACLHLILTRTALGSRMLAVAEDATAAELMGIRPERAGTVAYLLGSLMAGVSGILIAPVNTIFYDSGFLLGLKAFVGAIVGGMTSYPGAAIGAVGVGILESFASFQSSALKDVIVFSLLIPILIWRSLASLHSEEEIEE